MTNRNDKTVDAILIAVIVALIARALLVGHGSADLLPLWLAAEAMAEGRPDLVYPAGRIFDLLPPEGWTGRAVAAGYAGDVYPYLYPPLWVSLMAPLTRATDFASFAGIVHAANLALSLGTGWLAWRASGRPLPLTVYLLASQLLFHVTLIGNIAILQGQPQILVAFLTILAIERLTARADGTAGGVLALAAALKIYPLLYLVVLMAAGRWRAVAAFAGAGAGLATLSVTLSGWEIHGDCLGLMATMSQTALALPLTFSLDAIGAELSPASEYVRKVATPGWPQDPGVVLVADKSGAWSMLSKLALIATLATIAAGFRRAPDRVLLWPAAMVALALLSPLAWSYHFIAATAFAPALIPRWGAWRVALLFVPLATPLLHLPDLAASMLPYLSMIGSGVMALFALACILQPRSEPQGGARPAR